MKAYMKRTGSYMETTRLTVTVICLLLLLVVSPLYGRRYDMAIIPNTDVNLAGNIRDVLNSAGGNVTNEVITFFQERARLNKWSRHKPTPYRQNFDLDFSYDVTRTAGLVWSMRMPKQPASDSYFNKFCFAILSGSYEDKNWTYVLPAGGEAEPLRLGDFRLYNTNAAQPFTTGISNFTRELNVFNQDSFTAFCMMNQGSEFTLKEFFGAFTQYRLVVECYVEEGTPFYAMIAPTYRQVSTKNIVDVTDWADYVKIMLKDIMPSISQLVGKTVHTFIALQNIYSSGNPEPGTGTVAPWDRSVNQIPFYKAVYIKNYFDRETKLVAAAFTLSNPTWYPREQTISATFTGTRVFVAKMRIERKERGMYILSENSNYSPSSGDGRIKIRCTVAQGTYGNTQFGYPANSSLQKTEWIYIEPSSVAGQFQEFYMVFDSLLKIGTAKYIVFEATPNSGGSFVLIDTQNVSITCTRY